MKKIIGRILIIAGLLCIIAAVSLVMHNIKENKEAGEASEKALQSVVAQIPSKVLEDRGDEPAVDVEGRTFIGIVRIPSLGLILPVQSEWSKENARVSVCRYKGSVSTNDLIIAGHNYKEHFGTLKNLSTGDEVIFTDMNGRDYYYLVTNLETLGSTALEEMESGDWDLTLFTCTVGGAARVTVRCEATGEVTESGEVPDIVKAVTESRHIRQ